MAGNFSERLQSAWYDNSGWPYLLLPLSLIFFLLSSLRKWIYQSLLQPKPNAVPVVVVGNINVGGTGKTPLIITIANYFTRMGLQVGIISRGYGSQAAQFPLLVTGATDVTNSGDEALLIAKSTRCPVVICPKRSDALAYLLQQATCDLVLSDDGLQHYALAREYEIAVIDGARGLGNGLLLPAGPLRETSGRLETVDSVVVNGEVNSRLNTAAKLPRNYIAMQLKTAAWRRVMDDSEAELAELSGIEQVHGVAAIGNPQRFYQTLKTMNVGVIAHSFPDHHPYQLSDIQFDDDLPVVMTAKDAVKCKSVIQQSYLSQQVQRRYWYLPVTAQVPEQLFNAIVAQLNLSLPAPTTTTRINA